jgi:WD40 repeat protein/serine/threonine protein kinase
VTDARHLGAEIQAALKRRDWQGGLGLLEQWCARFPDHAPGWLWRAQCLAELGETGRALEAAATARALAPQDDRIVRLVGRLEERGGDDTADQRRRPGAGAEAEARRRSGAGAILWRIGSLVDGRYEVEGVARGGMGEVYFVLDRELGARIAVKTPLPSTLATAAGRRRFLREAEAWISLGLHPNICSAYYVREIGGVPRLFIEFVDGGSLAAWLREHREAGVEERLDLAIQIAAGMHHAHTFEWHDEDGGARHGVVHRDLKPANVLLDHDGVARVTDFGLVGRGAGDGDDPDGRDDPPPAETPGRHDTEAVDAGGVWTTMTMGGVVMGTPPYMPPEQWGGAHRAGKPADIYAFGCILYELLCGRRPFVPGRELQGAVPEVVRAELQRLHQEVAPPDPCALESGLDPDLAELMVACLAKAAEERPGSFQVVAEQLQQAYRRLMGREYPRPEPQPARLVADALNNRGVSFAALSQSARAETAWRQALRSDPHHVEASFNLGLHEWRRGAASDAATRQRMEEVLSNRQVQWRDGLLAGRIHLATGDYERAVERLRAALGAATGGSPEVARAAGFALCALYAVSGEQGLLQEAAAVLSRIGPAGRDDPAVLTTYARVLELMGDRERSARLYDEARRLRADLPRAVDGGAQRLVPGTHIRRPLTAFVGRALGASVSSDGALGLTRAEDGSLTAWNLGTGEVLRTIRPEGRRPRCHALSPDGRHLLTVADGDALVLGNPRTGARERRMAPHTGFINALAVRADGDCVAGVGSTGSVVVWRLEGSHGVSEVPVHEGFGTSLAWSGDGRYVVSGGNDGAVAVVDVAARGIQRALSGHRGAVTAVAVDSDADRVLSGGEDGTVRLWAVADGRCLACLTGHAGPVTFVSLHPERDVCLSGSADGTLRLWDLDPGEVRLSTVLVNGVTGGAATADWATVLVAHGTEVARLCFDELPELVLPWAVSTPISVSEAEDRAGEFQRSLEVAREALDRGDVAVALGAVRSARAVDGYERAAEALELLDEIATPMPVRTLAGAWEERCLRGHDDRVNALALRPDGIAALSAGADRRVMTWDLSTGDPRRAVGDAQLAIAVAYVGDGSRAALAGLDNSIQVWDLAGGGCVRVLEGHEARIFALAPGPRGRRLVSASGDETARVWDVERGTCVAVFAGHRCQVLCAAVAPDGRHAVSGGIDGRLLVWELATGKAVAALEGHSGAVLGVAWSADGRWVVSGGRDGTVRPWKVATAAGTCALETSRPVTAVAVTPNGRMALAGSDDGAVRLWDLARRECLRTFSGHDEQVSALAFLPDGRRIVSASADATLRLCYLDWEPEVTATTDWDDRVRPYLEVFLSMYGTEPRAWATDARERLLGDLGRRGLGFVRPHGVIARLERLASSGGTDAPRPGTDASRRSPVVEPRRRRRPSPFVVALAAGAGVVAAVVALVLWGVSLAQLDLNEREVIRSRRRVFDEIIRLPPSITRETCEPNGARSYLRTFAGLEANDWERMQARHCLEQLSDPRTVPVILSMARPDSRLTTTDARNARRGEALSALVRMNDDTTATLAAALADENSVVAGAAARALAYRGSESAIRELVRHATHPDPRVRIVVSTTLREIVSSGRIGRHQAFELFTRLAADGEWEVRVNVAFALDMFVGSRPRGLIMQLAQDSHPEVQHTAAQTLQSLS